MKTKASSSSPPKSRGRIMIIDDEAAMGRILTKSLELDGFEAVAYDNPHAALEAIAKVQPDLIITDVRMPSLSGHEVLKRAKRSYPEIPILIMTAYGTIEDAVTAMKDGAFNYITKPFQHENLVHQLELAMDHRSLEQQNVRLSEDPIPGLEARAIIGSSAGLEAVREMIRRAAGIDSSVLITGESGVGKELIAREIHRQSDRGSKRFVAVNCPAIPPTLIESELFGYERGAFTGADQPKMGLIELSDGGTLFLDEIGELPVELQVKLLRVIQEREIQRVGGLRQLPVDLRILSATNRDLLSEVDTGRFRLDLYYRLNVIPIHAPPLRERPEDIAELAEFFLSKIERRLNRKNLALADRVLEVFKGYDWPGNIRELENTLERLAIFSETETLGEKELPPQIKNMAPETPVPVGRAETSPEIPSSPPEDYRGARDRFEREYLGHLMAQCGGNVSAAAKVSGISRRTLYEKFDKLGIGRPGDRGRGRAEDA